MSLIICTFYCVLLDSHIWTLEMLKTILMQKLAIPLILFVIIIAGCKKDEQKSKLTDRLLGKKYRTLTRVSLPGIEFSGYLVLSFKSNNVLDYYTTTLKNTLEQKPFPDAKWEPIEEYGDKLKIQLQPDNPNIYILEAKGDSLSIVSESIVKVIYKEFKD